MTPECFLLENKPDYLLEKKLLFLFLCFHQNILTMEECPVEMERQQEALVHIQWRQSHHGPQKIACRKYQYKYHCGHFLEKGYIESSLVPRGMPEETVLYKLFLNRLSSLCLEAHL